MKGKIIVLLAFLNLVSIATGCRSDSSCSFGEICENRKCILGCRSNYDCAFDKACINSRCVDPCSVHDPCGRNADCRPIVHRPHCSCKQGFEGNPNDYCRKKSLSQITEYCEHFDSPENGEVSFSSTLFSLKCNTGYVISGSSPGVCVQGRWHVYPGNNWEVMRRTPTCVEAPLSQAAEGCEHFQIQRNGHVAYGSNDFKVQCDAGYISSGVSTGTCRNGRWYLSEREVMSSPPTCVKGCKELETPKNGTILCERGALTIGKRCTFSCNPGFKMEGPRARYCHTNSKWTGRATKCIPISYTRVIQNECEENNGGCSHKCEHGKEGRTTCSCPDGYTLRSDGKTCRDINECYGENQCRFGCHNTQGGYYCRCPPGYQRVDDYTCRGCNKNSYWSEDSNRCEICPENSYTSREGMTYISDCICKHGFRGSPSSGEPCRDIDECAVDNFGCSHKCINTMGGAVCACPLGYALKEDNKTCADMDECSIKNGGCDGVCVNTVGSFYCVCPEGYAVSTTDSYKCIDIDECANNNGGCEHLCVNHRGGYTCMCEEGYQPTGGLKNCSRIHCPRVSMSPYATMKCNVNGINVPDRKNTNKDLGIPEEYPFGTLCKFGCRDGFKSTLYDSTIKCKEDGTWEGEVPRCIPLQCPALEVPENGNVHPGSCSKHGAPVKEKCTFTCRSGYQMRGNAIFRCKNNLNWTRSELPKCIPVSLTAEPSITCSRDVSIHLETGKNSTSVTVPEPDTNMDSYQVHPDWVVVGEPVEFPAGKTDVTFKATNAANRTAECAITIHVFDNEPPTFLKCPESLVIENATAYGVAVVWEEPEAIDNVGVLSVVRSMDPNTTLSPGIHTVEYIATDAAGNEVKCSFDIEISRQPCSDLADPKNGRANCLEWMFGKLCRPTCEDGYVRSSDDPPFYSCIDPGPWEPSDTISDCI